MFIAGLDLGQQQDFSALAVAEVTGPATARNYAIRHLHRWQLRTAYPAIVGDVAAMFTQPPLTGETLVIDETGVGRAVADLFRQSGIRGKLVGVTITGGNAANFDATAWRVPKKDLVGVLQVLLGTRRLAFADVPLAKDLGRELANFKVKLSATTGHESFESWRESDHDDLVLAVALACWAGENQPCGATIEGSLADRLLWPIPPGSKPAAPCEPETQAERERRERERQDELRRAGYTDVLGVPIKLEIEDDEEFWYRR